MEAKEIKQMEDYFIKKNQSYAVYGLTRNEIKTELLLSEEEAEKYLKRKFVFSIGDVLRILEKIEDGELKSFNQNTKKWKWKRVKNVHSATRIWKIKDRDFKRA